MRASVALLVVIVAATTAATVTPLPVSAQIDPTHYWSYHLFMPLDEPTTFQARDQFYPQYRDLVTVRLERLLNPAWKYHMGQEFPPLDPTAHLTWWDLPDEPITRRVHVDNQFGEGQILDVEYLDFILLPARKGQTPDLPPPPDNINHYLCYRVVGPSPGVDVILRDQFHEQGQLVASATYLCNPCWKLHQGIEYAPVDSTHLVLYRLEIPDWVETPHFMRDQFTQEWVSDLIQEPDEYLAVPSTKYEVPTPTEKTSWGRVKSIFR